MNKKLFLYLSGGLGNQLFQYAAAKNIALNNKSDLILDKSSGFFDDYRFNRSFSLKTKFLKNVKTKKFVIFFLFFRFFKKILNLKKNFYKFYSIAIVNEYVSHKNFDPNLSNLNFKNKLYMMGLFQSEKYFLNNRLTIIKDIIPKKPSNEIFHNISDILSNNSVAVGVRMHEGLPSHLKHTAGGIVSDNFYLKAFKILLDKVKNPNFYFFSTKKSYIVKLIQNLNFINKYKIDIVTADDGYADAYDNLWLMCRFKNLIISNSTLYWWAAYFSRKKFKKNLIICSDQFPNKDTIPKDWIKIKS